MINIVVGAEEGRIEQFVADHSTGQCSRLDGSFTAWPIQGLTSGD
jgi:hypothetical protein